MDKILVITIDEILSENVNAINVSRDLIRIFTYPRIDPDLFKLKISDLLKIGIEALVFDGSTQIGKLRILGKGTNSLVIKVIYNGSLAVLKILRLDASRQTLTLEAFIIKKILNAYKDIQIVPKLYKSSDWYLITEYIEGETLFDFLSKTIFEIDKEEIASIIRKMLYKAYLLDKIKIDHGELSRPKSHVIIREHDDEPIFIDFESAKIKERPRNFSSLAQAIFVRHPSSEYLRSLFNLDLENMRKLMSLYNSVRDEDAVNFILSKLFNFYYSS